jgi:hypothetical protein
MLKLKKLRPLAAILGLALFASVTAHAAEGSE